MKKSDLKFGNVLRTYRDEYYLYTFNEDGKIFLELSYVNEDGVNSRHYDDLNEEFVFNGDSKVYINIPVIEIYEDFTCKKVLWEGNKDFNKEKGSELVKLLAELMGITTDNKPEFKVKFDKPCLVYNDRHTQKILGYLGTKTNIKDVEGNELYVGDIVKLEDKLFESESYVIEDNENGGKFGVMGMMAGDIVDGKILGTTIRKIKSYKDLKHNEIAGPLVKLKAKMFCEE